MKLPFPAAMQTAKLPSVLESWCSRSAIRAALLPMLRILSVLCDMPLWVSSYSVGVCCTLDDGRAMMRI